MELMRQLPEQVDIEELIYRLYLREPLKKTLPQDVLSLPKKPGWKPPFFLSASALTPTLSQGEKEKGRPAARLIRRRG